MAISPPPKPLKRRAAPLKSAAQTLPSIDIPEEHLRHGLAIIDLLVLAGLASSKSEARRLIQGGGARIDDQVVEDEMRLVSLDDLKEGVVKLSAGKKRHILARAR